MTRHVVPGWLDQSLDSLWRRDTTGFGSGLSRALAVRIGIDVVLVRVGFVVLAFCSGLGVALYAWGTALTPGPSGPRPIDHVLPSMRTWSNGARLGLVIGTSIAFVALVGSLTSLPWGLALIAAALLLWWLARHREVLGTPETAEPSVAMDEESLVEDWRRRMSAAVGARPPAVQLPVVDLFTPGPRQEPAPVPAAVRSGWLAGLLITVGSIGVGLVTTLVFGVDPFVALASGSAVLGLAVVLYAAISRRRRLPRSFLGLLLVPIVACGWLSAGTAGALSSEAGTHSVRVVAQSATVDLRDTDLTGIDRVEVLAIASTVDVILPGTPEGGLQVTQTVSTVSTIGDAPVEWSGVSVHVTALASTVVLVEGPDA